jgi:hypothetical protein
MQSNFRHDVPRLSFYDEAWQEAELYKWLESERCRSDLGPRARAEWARLYWEIFLRWKRLQHLYGHRRYIEFEDECFGKLAEETGYSTEVISTVAERFVDGWENLHFFFHPSAPRCNSDDLIHILSLLSINNLRRFQPPACWYAEAA